MTEFKSYIIEKVRKEEASLFTKLEELWTAVSPSIGYVNILFPEYTPHDVTHLKRLFILSEQLLKPGPLESLNSTECFLLAGAIIGHDWGMGVSVSEQKAIVSGEQGSIESEGPDGELFLYPLLPDENKLLRQHCSGCGMRFEWDDKIQSLKNPAHRSEWQNYLRDTHPRRSGQRLRQHFKDDIVLGDAIALISEGHGKNPSDIEKLADYPTNYPLNGKIVNIQALALYLRLIDLLDVGRGRTPYELWRFINPGDQRSAVEWKKHHAMEDPVVDGDTIKFLAKPTEALVLAEIFNLRSFCDEELSWQRRLLTTFHLDTYHYRWRDTNWEIKPRGDLHNTPCRFEFDRDESMRLLSEEIYDGDPYVFLRELIQNSIDATKARQLCRADPPLDARYIGISVNVDQDQQGRQTIRVRDVGSGMTEHIIKRYLSVLGKSYYQSRDFKKIGIEFDPISQFGIGILSCFSVADRINIQTRTDPQCFGMTTSEAWQIEIHSGRDGLPLGHWEWRRLESDSPNTGTIVSVVIDPRKWNTQILNLKATERSRELRVTDYLKRVTGFTEYPIYIQEGENKTVILHPKADQNRLDPDRSDYQVYTLPNQYDLASHVDPLDLEIARQHFAVEAIDLGQLGLFGVEGFLSYPKPKYPWRVSQCFDGRLTLSDGIGNQVEIRGPTFTSGRNEGFLEDFQADGMCKSAERPKRAGVYSQGILVPNISKPNDRFTSSFLRFPNIFLNLTKPKEKEHHLGPSRSSFRSSGNNWTDDVFVAHSKQLALSCRDRLLELDPVHRLDKILRILEQEFVSMENFSKGFEWDEWPVPVLRAGGRIEVKLLRDLKAHFKILEAPRLISQMASAHILKECGYHVENPISLRHWQNDFSVFELHFKNYPSLIRQYSSTILKQKFTIHYEAVVLKSRRLKETGQILEPFYANQWSREAAPQQPKPVFQQDYLTFLEKGVSNPAALSEMECSQIRPPRFSFRQNFGDRPRSFSKYCFWAETTVNFEHVVGKALCRAGCAFLKAQTLGLLSAEDVSRFTHLWISFPVRVSHQRETYTNSLQAVNRHLVNFKAAVEATTALNIPYFPKHDLSADDFLPGAFNFINKDKFICFSLKGDLFGSEEKPKGVGSQIY